MCWWLRGRRVCHVHRLCVWLHLLLPPSPCYAVLLVGTLTYPERRGYKHQLKVRVFDAPGDDNNFDYMAMDTLTVIAAIDIIIVVYDNTPEYCSRFVQLAVAMGKQCIFLRNKCDTACEWDEGDWKRYRTSDAQSIGKMGLLNPLVYGISARNTLKAMMEAKRVAEEVEPASTVPNTYDMYEWSKFKTSLANVGYGLLERDPAAAAPDADARTAPDSDPVAVRMRRMSAVLDKKLLAGLKSKGARPGQEAVKQAEEQSRTELFEEIARMSDRLASAAKAKDLAACQQAFWQLSQKISSLPGSS